MCGLVCINIDRRVNGFNWDIVIFYLFIIIIIIFGVVLSPSGMCVPQLNRISRVPSYTGIQVLF